MPPTAPSISMVSKSKLGRRSQAEVAEEPARPVEDLERYVCLDCDGTGLSDNPCPKRHPGPHLRFANTVQCLPCRNMFRTALKHVCQKKVRESRKKNPKKKEEFKRFRGTYIDKFEKSVGKQMRQFDDLAFPEFLDIEETQGMETKKAVSIFWPRSCLDREKVDYKEEDLKEMDGEDEMGLQRDVKFGKVSGCTEVNMARSKQIRKTTRVADASCAIADEMNQKWEVLGRSGLQVRDVEGGVVKIDEVGDKCGDDAWDNLLPTFSMGQADGHDDSEESSSDSGRRGKTHKPKKEKRKRRESLAVPVGSSNKRPKSSGGSSAPARARRPSPRAASPQ